MSLWQSRESYAMVSLPFFMVMVVGGGANGADKESEWVGQRDVADHFCLQCSSPHWARCRWVLELYI